MFNSYQKILVIILLLFSLIGINIYLSLIFSIISYTTDKIKNVIWLFLPVSCKIYWSCHFANFLIWSLIINGLLLISIIIIILLCTTLILFSYLVKYIYHLITRPRINDMSYPEII